MKVHDLHVQRNLPLDAGKVRPVDPNRPQAPDGSRPSLGKPFGDFLQQEIQGNTRVQFSAHAAKRVAEMPAPLSESELQRLDLGVEQVDQKGGKNALILVDDTAFIVSVKNKTVVTAVDQARVQNNVYTNIDSVAIV